MSVSELLSDDIEQNWVTFLICKHANLSTFLDKTIK